MPNVKAKALLTDMQRRYGPEAVMMASDIPVGEPISTGSLALDYATGFGGLPSNRVVEIYGRPGCIQGDAEVNVNRGGKGFRIKLRDLVHRFNGGSAGGKVWNPDTPTYVQREVDGMVRLARVGSAWASGVKTTYTVTTDSGRQVRATDEHPFFTERGWLRLDELKVDDEVHVRGARSTRGRQSKPRYRESKLLGHPYARTKNRVPLHRVIAEARLNDMSLGDFRRAVRSGAEGLEFLAPGVWAVHHQDDNSMNNDLGNLQVLTHAEHYRLHAEEGGTDHVQFLVATERVVSVEEFGTEETFDLEVEGDPHNFLANGFVVHNTGKTTLALQTMLNALDKNPQRFGLIMDVEHKMDRDWLEMIVGADLLKHRIFYMQPTSIERATNMYRTAAASGQVCCAILDSIGGAPTTKRNEDATVGHYGGNAMGVGEFAKAACTHASIYDCLTIGINQVRANMGMGYADETPGGHQWRHLCTLRIELVKGRETEEITLNGEKTRIGHTVFGKIRKNGVGPEGRTAMWWFFNVLTEQYGFGVDTLDEIIRLAIKTGVVKQGGGWYTHPGLPLDTKGDHKVKGMPALQQAIRESKALQKQLSAEVMASIDAIGALVAPLSDPEAPVSTDLVALYTDGNAEAMFGEAAPQ